MAEALSTVRRLRYHWLRMHRENCRRLRIAALFVVLGLATSAQAAPSRVADAVKNQDWARVRTLLDEGADVNTPQGDGAISGRDNVWVRSAIPALHRAASQGRA